MYINSTAVFVRIDFNRVRIKGGSRAQDSGHLWRQSDSIPGTIERIMGRVLVLDLSEDNPTVYFGQFLL